LLDYYAKARIFVLPTKRIEGFPVILPEAMLAGLPVVAMDLGGVREGVFDGETGFLINSGDFKSFEKKVELLVKDADLRQTLSENAKRKGRQLFSEAKMVDSYLEEILKL
jgi:glycosyltransferase involved in cell wall biosynthesis